MTPHAVIAPARLAGGCLMRAQSDERLVDLVRAGNERAFEAIVQRYRAPLLRHCRRLLKDGRAEDALQQALLRAHAAMQADDRPLHLRPWLFRIATNASLDALRQPGWSHEPLDPDVGGTDRPDQVAERHEDLRRALIAVRDLPRRQRDVIVLRELEGRSYEEIAEELGVTGGAVRQLLHRGRAGLRASASAVTPLWVVMRVGVTAPAGESASRIAELAAAGGGAGLAKGMAAVLAAGTVAGGVAVAPIGDHGMLGSAASSIERRAGAVVQEAPAAFADPVAPARGEEPSVAPSEPGRDDDGSGPDPGRDEDDDADGDDRSGSGRADDDSGRRRHRDGGGRRGGEVEPDGDLDDVTDGGSSGGGPGPSDLTATETTHSSSNSGPGSGSDGGSTSDGGGSDTSGSGSRDTSGSGDSSGSGSGDSSGSGSGDSSGSGSGG